MDGSMDSGKSISTKVLITTIALVIIALLLLMMFYKILGGVK